MTKHNTCLFYFHHRRVEVENFLYPSIPLLFPKVHSKFLVTVYKFSVHAPDICVCANVKLFSLYTILLALFSHLIILDIFTCHTACRDIIFVNRLVIHYMNICLIGALVLPYNSFAFPVFRCKLSPSYTIGLFILISMCKQFAFI